MIGRLLKNRCVLCDHRLLPLLPRTSVWHLITGRTGQTHRRCARHSRNPFVRVIP